MADLTFYGVSDDLVEVENEGVVIEEYPTDDAWLLVVTPDGRQAKVRVFYGTDGCWAVTYVPVGSDVDAPAGRIAGIAYSAWLILDVPEGTTVHRLQHLERSR